MVLTMFIGGMASMFIDLHIRAPWHMMAHVLLDKMWRLSLTLPIRATVLRLRSYIVKRSLFHLHQAVILSGPTSGIIQRFMKGE